ncbi:FkbM family methyltransferase [Pseudomonas sp. S31]|uniref:FkbM family methyltransferase n=1 Tax=Pseudomonas sp. S31 TaxID=1564473 RepID=UPI0019128D2C|nr:FkbM family methyltransferase [Pseudomonas sp. S31]MBK5000679.1 FkbM family methyltransferase [Pseudomonas sp. S31]
MKCCVIIPVGPGHQELAQRAAQSVAQAIETGTGPFEEVTLHLQDDSLGQGRSRARNQAVESAIATKAEWIFFLDADDLMAPEAFQLIEGKTEDNDGIWGAIYTANPITGEIARRQSEISPIDSFEQVLLNHPFNTLQFGHFIRATVAQGEPFNIEMDCGEDVDYYLRVWSRYRCIKLAEPLFYNVRGQHSTGPRAATGQDWSAIVPEVFSAFCNANEVIAAVPFYGQEVKFRLSNTLDFVQNQLAREQFFELRELTETLLVLPRQARIFDVGANIGNHALFFSVIGDAAYIHCFEPAQITADLLQANFALNEIPEDRFAIERIGVGAGPARASYDMLDPANLGATSLKRDTEGELEIDSLDNRHPTATIDLLKVDAQGMEMEVLAGAAELIKRNKPILLIEVSNTNKGEFLAWVARNEYRVHRAFELVNASNYLLAPRKLRDGFYDQGVAATRDWKPKAPLAQDQAPCGWSINEFFEGYLQRRRTLELLVSGEQLIALELTSGLQERLPNGTQDFGRRFPGSIVLLGELLGQITDGLLSNILDGLARSTQEIILFDLMDARWDRAFKLNHRYRDAEWYICQLSRRGYRLHNYHKLPHKAALGAGEQLDSRITLLHFKKG